MADEVSKKDLQAVEKNFNKQIADLEKKIDELRKEFNKDLEEENKITVTVRGDLEKRCDDLQNGINTLARAFGDIANKMSK